MRQYLKLMRVKHYIKNFLIFIPLFFNKSLLDKEKLTATAAGFVAFSLTCSAVYIFNDLKDVESDRNHPVKCTRPIASGAVSVSKAVVLFFLCLILSFSIGYKTGNLYGEGILLLYVVMNIAYSSGLKDQAIIDVVILASGFILRLIYGACITGIQVSDWLYLTIMAGALFFALGKRRNELKKQADHEHIRKVLKSYNYAFLDRNMYICAALVDTFYALWALNQDSRYIVWTVPLVVIILMRYSLNIEGDSDGDPVEVVLHDKILILLCMLYAVCMVLLLYI